MKFPMPHMKSLRLFSHLITTNCRCVASESSSSSSSGSKSKSQAREEFLSRVGRGRKTVTLEAAKPDAELYSDKPEYPPITPPFEDGGLEATKAEKKEIAELVKAMPTAEEKMFAVNPYERPFTYGETRWHQDYGHPRQDPRALFRVHAIPQRYNLLPFYQFITRTRCIDGLPGKIYEDQKHDREIQEFSPLALELIQSEQRSYGDRNFSPTEYVFNLADQITNAAWSLFLSGFPHLAEAQISRINSLEAVWVRGGFQDLYPEDDVKPRYFEDDWRKYILGDDRRRRGEMAFCLRDYTCSSIRNKHPLPEVVPIDDSVCREPVPPFVYAPLTLGLLPDKQGSIQWTPGFQIGNPYEFNAVQFYPIDSVMQVISKFKGASQAECYEECLRAASVALSFATLIGEAHYLGFTQYNDLTYPLTTQMILTDGQYWHFSIYQLNSIALINFWEESERPSNVAWCSGSMKLYESIDQNGNFEGLNMDVFKLILKFLLLEPKERSGVEMRPYVLNKATADEASLKSAMAQIKSLRRTGSMM